MLRVFPIPGEPTRFRVESNAIECCNEACRTPSGKQRLWNRVRRPDLRIGGPCPHCGEPLQMRLHLVDIAGFQYVGQCQCERFQFTLEPELCRMPPAQQAEQTGPLSKFRCHHIHAARTYALDLALAFHEHDEKKTIEKQRSQALTRNALAYKLHE